jgi:folate-binding protein YgfZ
MAEPGEGGEPGAAEGTGGGGAARPGAATGHRESAEVEWLAYGGPDESGQPFCEIPASFGGEVEAEYAAIRRGAALLDMPHRATLVVRGDDRLDLLDRLVSQKVRDLRIGAVETAFLTSRKGRIVADLLLAQLSDKLLIDVDITRGAEVASQIDAMIFGEDVTVEDVTSSMHRISVHGRRAGEVLAALTHPIDVTLEPGKSGRIVVAGVEVVVLRHDVTGEPGYEWIVPTEAAGAVWDRMLAVDQTLGGRRLVRPAGWFAFNMARVEAGTPIFNVDFGGDSLPHETGLLNRRVSFTKGCYPGQEVVARTEHLGRPKQILRGLVIEGEEVPVAGAQIFAGEDGPLADVVGTVTSSAPSPMRGLEPVALAVIKSKHAEDGGIVRVVVEGEPRRATIGTTVFWSGGAGVAAVGGDVPEGTKAAASAAASAAGAASAASAADASDSAPEDGS